MFAILILIQGIEDLERCHHDQQTNVHTELKKEMALLQKKILMDTVSSMVTRSWVVSLKAMRAPQKSIFFPILFFSGHFHVLSYRCTIII